MFNYLHNYHTNIILLRIESLENNSEYTHHQVSCHIKNTYFSYLNSDQQFFMTYFIVVIIIIICILRKNLHKQNLRPKNERIKKNETTFHLLRNNNNMLCTDNFLSPNFLILKMNRHFFSLQIRFRMQ